MPRLSRISPREQSGADLTTLGLLTLILIAVFLALTFGHAEGTAIRQLLG